jgi:hypothetical protein
VPQHHLATACARLGLKSEQYAYSRGVAVCEFAQVKDQHARRGLVEYIDHPIERLPYPGKVEFAEEVDEYLTVDGRGVDLEDGFHSAPPPSGPLAASFPNRYIARLRNLVNP